MKGNRTALIAGGICLLLTISTLYAQVIEVPVQPLNSNVIYLYQEGLPQDVDIETYARTGEVVLMQGQDILPRALYKQCITKAQRGTFQVKRLIISGAANTQDRQPV